METPNARTLYLLCLLLPAFLVVRLDAQQRYYDVWHFGDSSGIDFRGGTRTFISGSCKPPEGTTTLCDPVTGEVMLYSDGITVWNRNNAPMKNGTDLNGGASSTQAALAVPLPNNPSIIYLFTTSSRSASTSGSSGQADGLFYSIVDMSRDGGLGDVVRKNVRLLTNSSEKLVGVIHSGGCGYWIVTHEFPGDRFYAWLLTEFGLLEEPVISKIGHNYSGRTEVGHLKASPDGTMLFACRATDEVGDLFEFNPQTGVVEKLLAQVEMTYGASFSPDSRFLYTNYSDPSGTQNRLRQYDLRTITDPLTGVTIISSSGAPGLDQLYAMQLGPDGKLYAVRNNGEGKLTIGVINEPSLPGLACDYQRELDPPLPVQDFWYYGLPNCIDGYLGDNDPPQIRRTEGFDIKGDTVICFGESTVLDVGFGDRFLWEPAGGLSCADCRTPTASPRDTTTYVVTVFEGVECPRRDSVTVIVTSPPEADAGPDQTLCIGESVQLRGAGKGSYEWSPARGLNCTSCRDPLATPAETTTYTLTVTDENGCTDQDQMKITVLPKVRVSATDTTLCVGDRTTLRAEGGSDVEWLPKEGLDCPECAVTGASPTVTTTYVVRSGIGSDCPSEDSLTIHVYDAPEISITADTVLCVGQSLQLKASGGTLYSWFPKNRGLSCETCDDPVATPTSDITYRVLVTTENGCTGWDSVTVSVRSSGFVSATGDTSFCAGGTVQLAAAGAKRYRWRPATGLSCDDCPNPRVTPEETTTYYVTGFNEDGECPALDSVVVSVFPKPTAEAGEDIEVCAGESVRLNASGGVSYRWDPDPNLSCLDCPDPEVLNGASGTFVVDVLGPEGCADRDSVTVRVLPGLTISAGDARTLCPGESVPLEASAGTGWRWEPSSGLSCDDCRSPVASPSKTTLYRLTGWNDEGCVGYDSVLVVVKEGAETIRLRIPRDLAGLPGQRIEIPVRFIDNVSADGVGEIEFILEYDPGVVQIDPGSIASGLQGTALEDWTATLNEATAGYMAVRLSPPPGGGMLRSGRDFLRIVGRIFLGGSSETELRGSIRSSGSCFAFSVDPGRAAVDSVCGLSFRLIEASAIKFVPPVMTPNPASDRVGIAFGIGLDGQTRFEVFDAAGDRIGLILDRYLDAGAYSVEWSVADLPAGAYWYRITCGDWTSSGRVVVRE